MIISGVCVCFACVFVCPFASMRWHFVRSFVRSFVWLFSCVRFYLYAFSFMLFRCLGLLFVCLLYCLFPQWLIWLCACVRSVCACACLFVRACLRARLFVCLFVRVVVCSVACLIGCLYFVFVFRLCVLFACPVVWLFVYWFGCLVVCLFM